MEEFEQALRCILSNSKEEREFGERKIAEVLRINESFKYFLYGLCLSAELAALAGILFRQNFLENSGFLQLLYEQQIEIKEFLLLRISPGYPLNYNKNIGILIIHVSRFLKIDDEILGFIRN